jgi:hypothetical protein
MLFPMVISCRTDSQTSLCWGFKYTSRTEPASFPREKSKLRASQLQRFGGGCGSRTVSRGGPHIDRGVCGCFTNFVRVSYNALVGGVWLLYQLRASQLQRFGGGCVTPPMFSFLITRIANVAVEALLKQISTHPVLQHFRWSKHIQLVYYTTLVVVVEG